MKTKSILAGFCACACAASFAFGANNISLGGDPETGRPAAGPLEDAASWNAGHTPISTDALFIRNSCTITLTQGLSYNSARLTIANTNTGSLVITNGALAISEGTIVGASTSEGLLHLGNWGEYTTGTGTFTASGTLTIAGSNKVAASNGTVHINTGGALYFGGELLVGARSASTGILRITGGSVVNEGTGLIYIAARVPATDAAVNGIFEMTSGTFSSVVGARMIIGGGNAATQWLNGVATVSGGVFSADVILGYSTTLTVNENARGSLTIIGSNASISAAARAEADTTNGFSMRGGATLAWKADAAGVSKLDYSMAGGEFVGTAEMSSSASLDLSGLNWVAEAGETKLLELMSFNSLSAVSRENFSNIFSVTGYNASQYDVASGWGIGGLDENSFGVLLTMIPEPAASAACLGLLALALVARRRRA